MNHKYLEEIHFSFLLSNKQWNERFFLVMAQKEMTTDIIQPIRKYLVTAKKKGYPSSLRTFSFSCGTIQNTLWIYFVEMCFFFFINENKCTFSQILWRNDVEAWNVLLGYHFLQSSYLFFTTSWTPIATRAPGNSFSWLAWLNSLIGIHILKPLHYYFSIIP